MNLNQQQMKQARTQGHYDQIWQNTGKCVFCDLKDKYILWEENDLVLTINLFPYVDGQLMAIPRKHLKSPKELTAAQWETIRKFGYLAKKIFKQVYHYPGLWTLIREGGTKAQMTVTDHLHVQFIPFDQPDLCEWHYRQLQHTPLENLTLIKKTGPDLKKLLARFDQKYQAELSASSQKL